MKKKLEVGIIGLGKFGLQLGATLTDLGHRAVGVDADEHRVHTAQDMFSQVYQGDAADLELLKQLRFQDFDAVAVSVGRSMEASILVTLNLQELGAPHIIVKAAGPEHKKVLTRLGAHQVIQPEADVAVQTAYRLSVPGMLDLLPLGGGVLVQEIAVDAWEGKTLKDLNLRTDHGVLVAAVKRAGEQEFEFVPDPVYRFGKGDELLVIGRQDAVLRLRP